MRHGLAQVQDEGCAGDEGAHRGGVEGELRGAHQHIPVTGGTTCLRRSFRAKVDAQAAIEREPSERILGGGAAGARELVVDEGRSAAGWPVEAAVLGSGWVQCLQGAAVRVAGGGFVDEPPEA